MTISFRNLVKDGSEGGRGQGTKLLMLVSTTNEELAQACLNKKKNIQITGQK